MRKGQIQILDRAKRYEYSDACIRLLSREDLTLKQLEQLSYDLVDCRTQNDPKWIDEFLRLTRRTDIGWFVHLYVGRHKDVSYDELLRMQSSEQICELFSKENIVCETLLDAEFIIRYGYSENTSELLTIARRFYESYQASLKQDDWRSDWSYWSRIDEIVQRYAELSDYPEIWTTIDFDAWSQSDTRHYIENHIQNYFEENCPFQLKACKGIIKKIREIDFHGYKTTIEANGTSRFVKSSSKCLSISISPYSKVTVNPDGSFYTNVDHKHECHVLYFYAAQRFVTEYSTRSGSRYRATTLKDLFQAISIAEDSADENNAWAVISYLCNRYQTNIYKDLYVDFLQWNCILLPLTIEEASVYHSKKELFQKHYQMPITGDWNKKNANLSYLILKLNKRLSNEGLARAMQCALAPVKSIHVGKNRYKFACMLYSAVCQTEITPLLNDALREEYEMKRIFLNPEAQTINAHNERHRVGDYRRNTPTIRIKKDTRFKKLIDEMPTEFELIRTGNRITREAEMQHNCVRSYASDISHDKCMIYSVLYDNERHTIEIGSENSRYFVRQCFRACNRAANPELVQKLTSEIRRINQMN